MMAIASFRLSSFGTLQTPRVLVDLIQGGNLTCRADAEFREPTRLRQQPPIKRTYAVIVMRHRCVQCLSNPC